MENKNWMTGGLVAVLVLANSPFLSAKVIQGEIVEIDPQGVFLKVAQSGSPQAEKPEPVKIFITENSLMDGASFGDLRVGDEVWVDAEKSEAQNETPESWIARKIQLDKVDIKTTDAVVNKAKRDAEKGGVL